MAATDAPAPPAIDTLLETLVLTEVPTPKNADGAAGLLPNGLSRHGDTASHNPRLSHRRPSSPVVARLSFSALSMRNNETGAAHAGTIHSGHWPSQYLEGASVTSQPDNMWIPQTPLMAVTGRSPPTLAELQAAAEELMCFGDSFDAMLLVPVGELPPLPPPLLSAGSD